MYIQAISLKLGDAHHYNVVDYEDEFMHFCFCCSCCCVTTLFKYRNSDYQNVLNRMDGVSVSVNRDKCVGCGSCFKVCIYDGLKLDKGKSMNVPDKCIGCGRCESACPEKAITENFDETLNMDQVVDGIIKKIVDISG